MEGDNVIYRMGKRNPCSVVSKMNKRERRPCMTTNPSLTCSQRRDALRSLPKPENFSNLAIMPHDIETSHLNLLRIALGSASREDLSKKQSFKIKSEKSAQNVGGAETIRAGRIRRLSMVDSPLKRPLPSSFIVKSESIGDAVATCSASAVRKNSFERTGSFESVEDALLHRSCSVEGFDCWQRHQSKQRQRMMRWSDDRRKAQRVLTRSISLDDDNGAAVHSLASVWRCTMAL